MNAINATALEHLNQSLGVISKTPSLTEVAKFTSWFDQWLTSTHTEYSRDEKTNAAQNFYQAQFAAKEGLAPELRRLGTHIKARIDQLIANQDSLQSTPLSSQLSLDSLQTLSETLAKTTVQETGKFSISEQKDLITAVTNKALDAAKQAKDANEYTTIFQTSINTQLQDPNILKVLDQHGIAAAQTDISTLTRELSAFKALTSGGQTLQRLVSLDPEKNKSELTLVERLQNGDSSAVPEQTKNEVAALIANIATAVQDCNGDPQIIKQLEQFARSQLTSKEHKAYYTYLSNKYQEMHANKFDVEAVSQIMSKSLPGILFGGGLGLLFGSTWLGMIVGVIVDLLSKEKTEGTTRLAAPEKHKANRQENASHSVAQSI